MTAQEPGQRPQRGLPATKGPQPLQHRGVQPPRSLPTARASSESSGEREAATRHPTTIPATAQPYQGRRAGIISRLLASTIDAVVVVALLLTGYLTLVGARYMISPTDFSFPDLSVVFAVAAFLGVLVVYLTATWATTGRTYGDHVMGLRVVNFRGRRMRWAGAFVRAVACAFFPIGLVWVAVSRENRSLQDVVLRTSVIYDWRDSLPADAAGPS